MGQVFSTLKDFQSREENRTKAHNVLRGKRDTVNGKVEIIDYAFLVLVKAFSI